MISHFGLHERLLYVNIFILHKMIMSDFQSVKALSKNNFTVWRRVFGQQQGGAEGT
jgi:hypothetical protein